MVHEKLLRLLPGGKQQALTADRVFEPFSGLNPLHYNPYTEVVSCPELCMCTVCGNVCAKQKLNALFNCNTCVATKNTVMSAVFSLVTESTLLTYNSG